MIILSYLNFNRKNLPKNLRGIKIDPTMTHYKDNPHTRDENFINWAKDEFVPPFSKEELELYIKNPKRFRRDLLNNLRLYLDFCSKIGKVLPKVSELPNDKKIGALLILLFLFQSAMDNHYYKYDYLLDLEEYPKSPLGWHFLRAKSIVSKAGQPTALMLDLLTPKGKTVIKQLFPKLTPTQRRNLGESYNALQTFIKVQQEEDKLFYGKNMDSSVFTTGLSMWGMMQKIVKKADISNFKNKLELMRILEGNPILGTRKILVDMDKLFGKEIVKAVRNEITSFA